MKRSERVSVIIPNYNYARYLPQSINSVLNQTYQNFDLIVVNNGSTDNSIEVLNSFGEKIRIIDQVNLGQSGARNSGLKAAEGEFIAFLDADDVWEIDKLEKQMGLMSETTKLVYSGISKFSETSYLTEGLVLPQYRGDCSEYFINKPAVSIVLSGESTALFSRSLIELIGDFDLNLNSAAGWDFFRRCSKHTCFDFINEPLTNYRIHESNMSRSIEGNISDIRNAYKNIFEDNDWNIAPSLARKISRQLEISFMKTYILNRQFSNAAEVLRDLLAGYGR